MSDSEESLTIGNISLENLAEEQQRTARSMLLKNKPMWQGQLGEVNKAKHRIYLTPCSRPVYLQPYRAGSQSRKVIQENVDEMNAKGVIKPRSSECASTVVLAPKSDSTMRFIIDYLRLNALTVKDISPLPRMDYCLDRLDNAVLIDTRLQLGILEDPRCADIHA